MTMVGNADNGPGNRSLHRGSVPPDRFGAFLV